MNRVFVFGVAMFFAIVGIALLGGEKQAMAGHGCNGCHGAVACAGASDCCGPAACGGRKAGRARHQCAGRTRRCGGCEGQRLLGRRRCAGQPADCCGQPVSCCGTVVVESGGDAAEAAPHEAAPEAPPTEEPGGTAPVEEGATN